MVELFCLGPKAGFDVAQTFSVGELGESHTAKLFGTGKEFNFVVAVITVYTSAECVPWKVIHEC